MKLRSKIVQKHILNYLCYYLYFPYFISGIALNINLTKMSEGKNTILQHGIKSSRCVFNAKKNQTWSEK